jgi:hypothetical protein
VAKRAGFDNWEAQERRSGEMWGYMGRRVYIARHTTLHIGAVHNVAKTEDSGVGTIEVLVGVGDRMGRIHKSRECE